MLSIFLQFFCSFTRKGPQLLYFVYVSIRAFHQQVMAESNFWDGYFYFLFLEICECSVVLSGIPRSFLFRCLLQYIGVVLFTTEPFFTESSFIRVSDMNFMKWMVLLLDMSFEKVSKLLSFSAYSSFFNLMSIIFSTL